MACPAKILLQGLQELGGNEFYQTLALVMSVSSRHHDAGIAWLTSVEGPDFVDDFLARYEVGVDVSDKVANLPWSEQLRADAFAMREKGKVVAEDKRKRQEQRRVEREARSQETKRVREEQQAAEQARKRAGKRELTPEERERIRARVAARTGVRRSASPVRS